jgi:hypothetical protein
MNSKYWAAYTKNHCRWCEIGNDLNRLRNLLERMNVEHYAIYNNAPGFHSTTQTEFLVEHKNDPYLTKQGIESK